MLFKYFENTKYIDINNILWNNCKKSKYEKNEFYICMNCNKINLCSICKRKHDNIHIIIKYKEKDIIFNKHYEI